MICLYCFSLQVLDYTAHSGSSVDGLDSAVKNIVAQLKKQGVLSGETIGQIFSSVATKLNGQSDESTKVNRQKVTAFHRHLDIESILRSCEFLLLYIDH